MNASPPPGWTSRIARRDGFGPVLHLATFPLHDGDGDFGAAATGRMRGDDAFAALLAYPVDAHIRPGSGLFAAAGWQPRLRARDFGPAQLQVTRPGQIGCQRFFTHGDRPFCLYAVLAPVRKRPEKLAGELSVALATIRFAGRPT